MTDDALSVLSAVESAEAALLAWGLVDGTFEEEELVAVIQAEVEREGLSSTADDLLDELLERRLIIRVPDEPHLFRTRMAETVRLLARLRQLFTKHHGTAWRSAPRLVADFRFALQPRRYPTRDIAVDDALATLERDLPGPAASTWRAARAMLTDRGDGFALSAFQVEATRSILGGIHAGVAGATMVSAGTGSGKTLAFYLPVLSDIAGRHERGPQAVAVYPRNELLKDQFSQTYVEARRLDGATASGAKVTIGAFFGGTPHSASESDTWMSRRGWTRHGDGRACPYLRCPRPGCAGPLVWPDGHLQEGAELLICSAPRCTVRIESDEVILTRERLRDTPPDVLFTTTEMLNRNLSSWEQARLIGIEGHRPRVALIDEAHTYTGIHGAQSALLLRRWHAAAGGRMHFVGLSATLADAADFFARLTGIADHRVTLVEPADFDEDGMEYQLVLRGDPASGTQLLSTTIQAAMLMRRALDLRDAPVSRGVHGSKAFVFTDDLDVTNRLYHAMRDAEGLGPYRQERRPGATPLAALRSTTRDDVSARRQDGQAWDLAESIGHDLSGETLLNVTRVSSQDAGVNDRSDLIVATASLEVGFNDAEVGAVLQHKAPREDAAFVQRRGRAGRTRTMRPWTVVTLSDFGRDRFAYDAYDVLFDPALRPRPLPISNRAVLRMQATYAWLDWTARRLAPSQRYSSVWRALAGPGGGRTAAVQREAIATLIEQTLDEPAVLADLAAHLRRALDVTEEQVEAVLWEPPRALVTAVLPTALRRLRSEWYHPTRNGGGVGRDFRAPYDPLPDFVPPNLFSELSLPEVQVTTPPQSRVASEEVHPVPILQAIRTFAPGNVSLRFAVERRGARSWVAPPEPGGTVDLSSFVPRAEVLGLASHREDGVIRDIECVRPWELHATPIPDDVNDSSGGRLDWRTQIRGGSAPHTIGVPQSSEWHALFTGFEFHTHNRRSPAAVRRFAVGGEFSTLRRSGDEQEGTYEFLWESAPAALGFELDADGFVVKPQLPARLAPASPSGSATRAFRTALFAERIATDGRLDGVANSFKRGQLEQVYLSALVDRSLRDGIDLESAWTSLHAGDAASELRSAVEGVFATGVPASTSQDDSEERRGAERLVDLAGDPGVIAVLQALAPTLWEAPGAGWEPSARRRVLSTLAASLASACEQLCPEFSRDEIVVDVGAGVQPDRSVDEEAIWVTERVVGGGGVVEEVHRRLAADPRRFLRLIDRALAPGDFEVVDEQLPRILELAVEDGPVKTALARLRSAGSHADRRVQLETLIETLQLAGIDTRHAVVAAANARVLRPGTSSATDEALRRLARDWRESEEHLGIELETRIFAYTCRERPDLEVAIPEARGAGAGWRYGQVLGVLWPHGWRVRASALLSYNEFAPHAATDQHALRALAPVNIASIDLGGDWWTAMSEVLVNEGVCELRCPSTRPDDLADALVMLGLRPIDTGSFLLHAFVEGIDREGDALRSTIALEAPSS
jgi:DEAD/DEAH box helicase